MIDWGPSIPTQSRRPASRSIPTSTAPKGPGLLAVDQQLGEA
jgi:hypothetical protein